MATLIANKAARMPLFAENNRTVGSTSIATLITCSSTDPSFGKGAFTKIVVPHPGRFCMHTADSLETALFHILLGASALWIWQQARLLHRYRYVRKLFDKRKRAQIVVPSVYVP